MPIDPKRPLLSGTAALIVGTLGTVAAGASILVPAPWGTLVAILGFLAAAIAGYSVAPPKVVEGKPLLQGVALTVAMSAEALLHQFFALVPAGWPQSIALSVAALLAWLTGHALPQLGAPSVAVVEAAEAKGAEAAAAIDTKAAAVSALEKGPQP